MQRQIHILSSVGLFYLIIVGMFAIPLLATFVVVLIQGVFDFRYVILGVGTIIGGMAIYFAGKLCYRIFRKIKQDGAMAIGNARQRASMGESVQLQLLGGLFSFTYGGYNGGNNGTKSFQSIAYHEQDPLLIEDMRKNQPDCQDPISRLKELSTLKNQGIIDEEEFRKLKETLIRNVCET